MNELLELLLDDEGWTHQTMDHGIHVWTREEPGTDLVTVRLAAMIEGPFDHFASIGKEIDLIKTWMPGVKTSYVVNSLTTFDQIGYYTWKFPLITGRDFLVEEKTHINDSAGYLVVKRYPPLQRPEVTLPPVQKSHIRAAISQMCSFSAPIGVNASGKKCSFCVTVMNVDLKIPLPARLVNYLSVKMGAQSFKDLRANVAKSQESSSPFYTSVQDPAHEAYYGRMRSLEQVRDGKPIGCLQEILETGWVKDPIERRKLFARSEGVLVPMKAPAPPAPAPERAPSK